MKKTILVLTSLIILASATSVFAEEAGMTPDNPLYFFKTIREKIQTIFTFNADNKVKQYLHLADVRLVEYEKMLEKGKEQIAQKVLVKYQAQIEKATALAEKIQLRIQEKIQAQDQIRIKIQNKARVSKGCRNSGGTMVSAPCCKLTDDFPSSCMIGACGCSPDNSKETKICDCGENKCFDGEKCVGISE